MKLFFVTLINLISLTICLAQDIEKNIANYILVLDSNNYQKNDLFFNPLKSIIKDKQIIILGESSHGDGKTFEVKVNMIKYLQKEFGFNTVAMEGAGFLDMQLMSGKLYPDSLIEQSFSYSWYSMWSNSKQVQPLIEIFKNDEINYFGIENQPVYCGMYLIRYLKTYLKDYQLNFLNEIDWKKLHNINNYLNVMDSSKLRDNDITFYKKNLILIKDTLQSITALKKESFNESREILIEAINNALSFAEQYSANLYTYEGQNKGINIRDRQMAKNLIWYLDRHPEEKIIVWTANFHGAKNINQVRYNDTDTSLYNSFKLFASYIDDKYGDKLYSIAFTSSTGNIGNIYEQEPSVINPTDSTLENELYKKDIIYGFINFAEIRNDSILNTKFNSTVLGYSKKKGRWLNVFDGLFYIHENEKAVMKK
jgi:erythromycin esterase